MPLPFGAQSSWPLLASRSWGCRWGRCAWREAGRGQVWGASARVVAPQGPPAERSSIRRLHTPAPLTPPPRPLRPLRCPPPSRGPRLTAPSRGACVMRWSWTTIFRGPPRWRVSLGAAARNECVAVRGCCEAGGRGGRSGGLAPCQPTHPPTHAPAHLHPPPPPNTPTNTHTVTMQVKVLPEQQFGALAPVVNLLSSATTVRVRPCCHYFFLSFFLCF